MHNACKSELSAIALSLGFSRSGKDCALELKLLPPGTVVTDVILEGEQHFGNQGAPFVVRFDRRPNEKIQVHFRELWVRSS